MNKITIGYISDIHADFYCKEYNPEHPNYKKSVKSFATSLLSTLEEQVDVLIIAGDLGHRNDQNKLLLQYLKEKISRIVLVTGNHCLYLVSDSIGEKFNWDSFGREKEMIDFCKSNGIDYLTGDSIEINGFTIAGLGMFWDKSYAEMLSGKELSDSVIHEMYEEYMNDLRYIAKGTKPIPIRLPYGGGYLYTKFNEFTYFEEQKARLDAIKVADIMVTHYIPVPYKSMPLEYQKAISTTFYTFDGKSTLDRLRPYVWIFGHTHSPVKEDYNGTLLLCNPYGYPRERINKKIEVITIEK